MSPLEYLFVMMMKLKHPDAEAMAKIEPGTGEMTTSGTALHVDSSGRLSMKTILMQSQNRDDDRLEVPLRIDAQWEPLFKIGAPVAVKMDKTGEVYKAKISKTVTVRDENGTTTQAIARLESEDATLQPGLTGIASLVLSGSPALPATPVSTR